MMLPERRVERTMSSRRKIISQSDCGDDCTVDSRSSARSTSSLSIASAAQSPSIRNHQPRRDISMATGLAFLAVAFLIAATIAASPLGIVSLTRGQLPLPTRLTTKRTTPEPAASKLKKPPSAASPAKTLRAPSKTRNLKEIAASLKEAIHSGPAAGVQRRDSKKNDTDDAPVQQGSVDGVDYLWQLPPSTSTESPPTAILFLAHGCGGSMYNWFPPNDATCPECLGMPESTAIVQLARQRGMVVVAASSNERTEQQCWLNRDGPLVAQVLQAVQQDYPGVPLLGFGSSSGGEQVGRFLPNALRDETTNENALKGIVSQNKVPKADTYDLDIAAAYVKLPRDVDSAQEIDTWAKKRTGPTKLIALPPYVLEDDFFSTRMPCAFSKEASKAIVRNGKAAGLVDEQTGDLLKDPLAAEEEWTTALSPLVEDGSIEVGQAWFIWQELTVAWGFHATTRDGVAEAFDWLLEQQTLTAPASSGKAPTRG